MSVPGNFLRGYVDGMSEAVWWFQCRLLSAGHELGKASVYLVALSIVLVAAWLAMTWGAGMFKGKKL